MPDTVEQVLIEAGQVTLRKVVTEKVVALSDYLASLSTKTRLSLPRLPKGILHIDVRPTEAETHLTVVVENEFGLRRVNWRNSRRNGGGAVESHLLNFPYVYFVFFMTTTDATLRRGWAVNDWHVWMANNRATSFDAWLWPLSMYNCYSDGRICFGNLGVSSDTALGDYIDQTINIFWTGEFNEDVQPPNGFPVGNSLADWAADAARNEMGWQQWPIWTARSAGKKRLSEELNGAAERMTPLILPDTIPNIPLPATASNIDGWFNSIPPDLQERIRDHTTGAGRLIMRPRTA